MTVDEFIQRLKQDPARVGGQIKFAVGLIVGLSFLIFGIRISQPRLYILAKPARTVGRIIGYVRRTDGTWNASHTVMRGVTGYFPTVVFQVGAQVQRFEDWRAVQRFPPVNSTVPVIYDPRNPSNAMIDRSVWNFIPWAPITVIGLLVLLNALRYWPTRRVEDDPPEVQP